MYFTTISEMLGTGGEKIARQVAKELNYTFYGEEELFKAADEMGFLSDIKKLGEKSPALLERFFGEKPKIYLDRLQSVIYEVARKGDAVFFGRGSQFLLHSFDCAFHVLVTGSMEKRVKRVMEEKQVNREVAERVIHRSDHDKRGFIRFAFDEDWLNPNLYDLIPNTDKLSVDLVAKMIVDGARSEEIKSCGIDSVTNLKKLSLQRQIESALLESGLMTSHLFFTIENGDLVRVFGMVNSQEEKEKVETLVKKAKDIKRVSNDLVIVNLSMAGL
ncbi:MAG: cytidylate kinase family protein [Deltaproteobacteria bacterium]|nr:cytidylate kinase family protein [Deltaproteobacteria bacterium]